MAASDARMEAGFFNMETRLQCENTDPIPFIIEEHMLKFKVNELKRYLLTLDVLAHAKVKPEQVHMYLLLPGEKLRQGDHLLKLEDDHNFGNYRADLSRCLMIKLLKEPHGDATSVGHVRVRE